MPKSKIDNANKYQKLRSHFLREQTQKVISQMMVLKEPLSVSAIARKAGVSKSFIYKNESFMEQINQYNSDISEVSKDMDRIQQLELELEHQIMLNKKLEAEIDDAHYMTFSTIQYELYNRYRTLAIYEKYDELMRKSKDTHEN